MNAPASFRIVERPAARYRDGSPGSVSVVFDVYNGADCIGAGFLARHDAERFAERRALLAGHVDAERFPTLARLLASGAVFVEQTGAESFDYVGKASDGALVSVGNVRDAERTERYLAANPQPDQW